MSKNCVIAAIRDEYALLDACKSDVRVVFDLSPSIETIDSRVELCREYDKYLFLHIDMAEGIGKDRAGLWYVKSRGVRGIISTRPNLIKLANELGLETVHRMFIIDSHSVETAIAMFKTKSDMVEIMPGIVAPRIIERICDEVNIPVIAGGLIETRDEIASAIKAGAVAVSTGNKKLWNM